MEELQCGGVAVWGNHGVGELRCGGVAEWGSRGVILSWSFGSRASCGYHGGRGHCCCACLDAH